jgi:hypothetical protein
MPKVNQQSAVFLSFIHLTVSILNIPEQPEEESEVAGQVHQSYDEDS